MTILTFGKYKGQSVESLKRIDSGYLEWGSRNLRSEFWRQEFGAALAAITIEDTAHEIVAQSPDIDYYEALQHARDEAADAAQQQQEEREAQAKEDAIIMKYAPALGITLQRGRELARIWDWEDIPEHRFSTHQKYENFRAMMAEIHGPEVTQPALQESPTYQTMQQRNAEIVTALEARIARGEPPEQPQGRTITSAELAARSGKTRFTDEEIERMQR